MTTGQAAVVVALAVLVGAGRVSHAEPDCPPVISSTTTSEPRLIIEPPHPFPPVTQTRPPTTLPVTR